MIKRMILFILILIIMSLVVTLTLHAWTGDTWGPISRETMVRIADEMIDFSWSPLSTIQGWNGYPFNSNQIYTAEAYYKKNLVDNWQDFYIKVNAPPGGNTNHGNDCSGFVSISWKLPIRYDTNGFLSDANSDGGYVHSLGGVGTGKSGLQRGDAFVTDGHMMLFHHYVSPEGIWAMEQTPEKARYWKWTWGRLASYQPIRRNRVSDYRYDFQSQWGSSGSEHGQFLSPQGMAVDSSGYIYVADTDNHRIQKFYDNGSYISFRAEWGTGGSDSGEFWWPMGMAVDSPSGVVYVADSGNNRIQVFNTNGVFRTKWGGPGSGDGQFSNPVAAAVDSSGYVYVADQQNDRIQKFDSSGRFIKKWGSLGSQNGQFIHPTGVVVDFSGSVYVVDSNNCRVQKFDSNGNFITKWGFYGPNDGQFSYPWGITVDSAGYIYVCDSSNRVQKFDGGGNFIAGWNLYGIRNGQTGPADLAVAGSGIVYVADTDNDRVQKFSPFPLVPSGPSLLLATAVKPTTSPLPLTNKIFLQWQDNSNNEGGFKIRRKEDVRGSYSQGLYVGRNPNNSTVGFTDNVSPRANYYYVVSACTNCGTPNEVESEYSNEFFVSNVVLNLKLTAPNKGENIPSGSTFTIRWQTNQVDSLPNYTIDYSTNGGTTWNNIATNIVPGWGTNQSYNWQVPAQKVNRPNCKIRVTAYDSFNRELGKATSNLFAINVLELTYPNGGEAFTPNQTILIRWQANATIDTVSKVVISYIKTYIGRWQVISTLQNQNPGSLFWTVPQNPNPKALGKPWKSKIKVELYKTANNVDRLIESDVRDNYFSVGSGASAGLTLGIHSSQALAEGSSEEPDHEEIIEGVVTNYFDGILNREADQDEMNGWIQEIERVESLGVDIKEGFTSLVKTLFSSAEYLSKNRSDAEYVDDLYEAFFHEVPDPASRDAWLGLLNQGWTREMILNGFLLSEDFDRYIKEIFGLTTTRPEDNLTNDFYRGFLGRLPDAEGFNDLLDQMRTAQCDGEEALRDLSLQIGLQFIQSLEYTQRNRSNVQYIGDVHDAILERLPDLESFNFWLTSLNDGTITRDELLQELIDSPEFQDRVQQVAMVGGLSCPAILIAPSGTMLDATPPYIWYAVPGSTQYQLQLVDSAGNNLIQQWYTATDAGCDSGEDMCWAAPSMALSAGIYTWRIQTYDENGPWSNDMSLTVSDHLTPAVATLMSPSETITTTTPTYTWFPVFGSTQYRLELVDSAGNNLIQQWYTVVDAGCVEGTGTCQVIPSASLAEGTYKWRIQTFDENGPWSDALEFTVSFSPGAATLISPSGAINAAMPTYTWNAVSGSTWYHILVDEWVNGVKENRVDQWCLGAAVGCNTGTCSVTPSTPLTSGSYTWLIQTSNGLIDGPWSNSMSFTVDITPPTTTISPAGGTYNSAQSVILTCSDGTGSGCDKIYYTTDGSTPTTLSPVYSSPIAISATTTLKFFSKDLAGNSEAAKTQIYTIDAGPPTGTIVINSGALSTNSVNVTLTLTCSDASGCSQMQFSNDNVTYSTPETYDKSKAWTLTSGDGTKTVYAKFKDAAGNWSTPSNSSIVLDTTLPTGTITINSGAAYTNSTGVTLTLTCSDTNVCSQMQFSNDGSSYSAAEAYATTKAWTLTSGDGTKTVYVKFKDAPGNWSTTYSDTILLDTTSPAGTIVINSGSACTNSTGVTLTLSCSDASGCSQMQFSNDDVTYSSSEAYATTKAWTLTTGDGTKTVYGKFKDAAGNWSSPFSDTIALGSPVKIGSASYSTLQSAYNAAGSGDTIKSRAIQFIENLTVNRNITVTLEGGYDCGFTTNFGTTTSIKGLITTTAGGGKITIKNFVLNQ